MIDACVHGIRLQLHTHDSLFSPKWPDAGTLAMLSYVNLNETDVVLDLGCGYGLVGIWAAKQIGPGRVTMCDILRRAVDTARDNARYNGVEGVCVCLCDALSGIERRDFTLILCNPPYHEDFATPKRMIEQGYAHLAVGGRMMMVTKRRLWYEKKLTSVFGGVTVRENDGYYVFTAQKRAAKKRQ